MIESLKEHKLVIAFIVVILAAAVFFFRGSLFRPALQSPTPQQVALEKIKNLIINKKDCVTAMPQLVALTSANPNFVEAIDWQGVCQFQMGKLADAKVTFEKALALDSKNAPAQNYLKIINEMSAGSSVTVSGGATMSQTQFESILGFTPDKTKFSFIRLAVVPVSTTTESVAAFYKSSLSEANTTTYFTSRFKQSSIKYSVNTQTSDGSVYATVTFTKPN